MKVVPLNDKIVIKRLAAEEKTAGGIVLPDTAREKPKQGKVRSVGDGRLLETGKRVPFQVKEGDSLAGSSGILTGDRPWRISATDEGGEGCWDGAAWPAAVGAPEGAWDGP